MSPKPDVSEERTEQIIEAALKVFAERGMEKTRMEDIGAAAGLSKATLYLYFKTKDVLIAALMKRVFGYMLRGFRDLDTSDSRPAKERLRGFATLLVEDLHRMRPLLPLLYEFYAMGLRQTVARDMLGEFVREFIATLTPVIETGIASGELRAVDVEKFAITLGATLEGTLLLWAFAPDRVEMESQIIFGMDLLLSSL